MLRQDVEDVGEDYDGRRREHHVGPETRGVSHHEGEAGEGDDSTACGISDMAPFGETEAHEGQREEADAEICHGEHGSDEVPDAGRHEGVDAEGDAEGGVATSGKQSGTMIFLVIAIPVIVIQQYHGDEQINARREQQYRVVKLKFHHCF